MNSPIIKEFRDFILSGDIIAIAIAFILAIKFNAVVAVFTDGILMRFIAAIVGEPNFDTITLDVGDAELLIGSLLTAIVDLLIVGAAIFFLIVKPLNMLKERSRAGGEPVPEAEDIVLLREIRDALRTR